MGATPAIGDVMILNVRMIAESSSTPVSPLRTCCDLMARSDSFRSRSNTHFKGVIGWAVPSYG